MSAIAVYSDNRVFSSAGNVVLKTNLRSSKKSVRFGRGGVMVYSGISIDGRVNPHTIQKRALIGQKYKNKILRTTVVTHTASIETL